MTYYLYHIPGKKIGVTSDLENRVHKQQGYYPHEYEVLETSNDIDFISAAEQVMQKFYKYRVDEVPYNKLKCNKMKINVTEQTTTFPVPINKLKGRLVDNIGMRWSTEHGDCLLTAESIKWIMKNVKESMYNKERCYVYNKAFARWFDNNNVTLTGGIMSDHRYKQNGIKLQTQYFDLIREWADERGLYAHGDRKTQALKLIEEVGETCRAILKDNDSDIEDGIGDCVVVLTNLAELQGTTIEACIERAYNEIKDRTGKMDNGTFKKD
jgi:NTP pyrophosphatase (non-canonical NTP hydrolase)